jgi:sugar lactone lactonase YvrE
VALVFGSAVHRYSPDGQLDRIVQVPASIVTSCCFGGRDLDQLYITTGTLSLTAQALAEQPHAGGIFRYVPGVQGQAPNRFAG